MHYKIIFLIISSDNDPIYSQMREILPKYLNLYSDKIQYFFLECNPQQDVDILENGHYLYSKGSDSIVPGIYQKTLKSLNYICQHYSFDFVIRTNLSTFWHMENLLALIDTIPIQGYAGGFCFDSAKQYLSGTSIILSADVGKLLIPHLNDAHSFTHNDDVVISDCLRSENVAIRPVENYIWDHSPSFAVILPEHDISKVLNFRIKNYYNDRNVDVTNFKILLKKLYGLTVH